MVPVSRTWLYHNTMVYCDTDDNNFSCHLYFFIFYSLEPLATLPVKHLGLIYLFMPSTCFTGNPVSLLPCDVELQRKFLSFEVAIVTTSRKNRAHAIVTTSPTCNQDIGEQSSICCDSCLDWFHFKCVNKEVPPKKKYGIVGHVMLHSDLKCNGTSLNSTIRAWVSL